MAITASDVNALRQKTGVGMMDCKKALTEANGDMDKAIEILREKGMATAAKKAGRIAAEGIVDSYGLENMKLKTLSIGLNYQAIERGEIEAADVFTTDPQLLRSDLVVLDDDKKLFGFQNVVPLIRDDAFAELDDDASHFLNELQSLLTLEAIQAMNEASAINRLDPAQVAKMFLDDNGLM